MKTVIIASMLLFTASAFAAEQRGKQAIKIKSDELFTDSAARTATFTGKVMAQQADITIHADKLVVLYSDKEQEVGKVEATGNVRISQGTRLAQAGHATYDNQEGKIVLDMNPKVFEGDNVITGKTITYFVNNQRSIVTGGPDARVEAVIHPKGKGNNGSPEKH